MSVRILIADDNAVFRKTLRQILAGTNHWEIVEATDGQEAITKSLETQPNLIILDLAMPVKDGLAAAREISQLLPNTPILMCTMHMSSHVEAEALKSGIRKVLSKSDSHPLLEAMRQLLPAPDPSPLAPAIDPILAAETAPVIAPAAPATSAETVAEPASPSQPKSIA